MNILYSKDANDTDHYCLVVLMVIVTSEYEIYINVLRDNEGSMIGKLKIQHLFMSVT